MSSCSVDSYANPAPLGLCGFGITTILVKKSLQIDYSAASDRAYADLIGLRPNGISKGSSSQDSTIVTPAKEVVAKVYLVGWVE